MNRTSVTLLARLRDGEDEAAWAQFERVYGPALYSFARSRGCSEATALDVSQDVKLKFFQRKEAFDYEPRKGRFRNWLFTVLSHELAARRRRRRAPESIEGREEIPDDANRGAEHAFESHFERAVALAILDRVRAEVEPTTWSAFELTALHGWDTADAARWCSISKNAVFLARNRVKRRLSELGVAFASTGALDPGLRALAESYASTEHARTAVQLVAQGNVGRVEHRT